MTTISLVQGAARAVSTAPRAALGAPASRMAGDSFQVPPGAIPWRASAGNRFDPLVDRTEVLLSVMDAIHGARHTLQFQSYLFGGAVSQQIAEALVERKKAGVTVQVLLDPKLSIVGADDDGKAIAYLKANGVDVRTYPVKRLNEGEPRWRQGNPIDHAKLLVADGHVAIAGGMNLSDAGVEAHDFMARIEGAGATQLGEAFDEDWVLSGGRKADKPASAPMAPMHGGRMLIAENSASRHNLAPLVIAEIQQAKRSVAVEALFMDHPEYIQSLVDAHRRGVKVQVLLDQSAVKKFMDLVPGGKYARGLPVETLPNLPAIAQLREAGVPVRLYEPHDGLTYLHGKLALVDDRVTLLGSANFTRQAAQNNRELMMAMDDPEAARRFKQVFEDDWKNHSTAVDELPAWQRRLAPWVGRVQETIFGAPQGF